MDCRLDVVACQERHGIACVDCQAAVQGLGPFPVPRLVILDLQSRDRLTKEESQGSQIGVTVPPRTVTFGESLLLFFRELAVFHVSKVIFGFLLVLV